MSLNAYICVEFLPEANAEELSRKKEVRFPKPVTTRRVVGYRDQKQIDTRRQKRQDRLGDPAPTQPSEIDDPETSPETERDINETTQPEDIGD
ncbi:unnamed protein product, partial [Enterobius vermicularis]|uniref:KID domain-containing protein n=1 Tax=Enterobius vermicularis TaxID=51028 RepID=A0A0N4VNH1_ENTVE